MQASAIKMMMSMNMKGEETDESATCLATGYVDLIALVSVALSILVFWWTDPIIVDIASVFLAGFAPYVSIQKRQIAELGGFREQINELRERANVFMGENERLTHNVRELKSEVDELETVEADLKKIASTENVDRLVQVVQESKEVNEEMRTFTKSSIVQQIITTVIRTDRDLDLKIGPIELKRLMSRLNASPGFDFHEDRFLKTLGETNDEPVSIVRIMKVIRNLKDDSIPEDENIFVLKPEQLLEKGENAE